MIMSLFTKIQCGLVLALPLTALSLFGVLGAQEPKRDQNNNNSQAERRGQDRPGVPGANNNGPRDFNKGPMPGNGFMNPMMPPKPDKELEAWIKILADKMTDRNDDIRNSARRALVSVGPAAMFSLKEMTESKDAATAVAARNVMMEIGRSTMQQNMMMQRGGMPFAAPKGMPGMGGWGKMNPQDMNRKAGPGGPPREGDRKGGPEGRPEGDRKGKPEGDRKAGPANPPREGDKRPEAGKPEAGRPEGERKAGPANPPREGDKRPEAGKPEAGRPEGERKANPPREGDRRGPGVGPEARERMLNDLNLSKDVRAKVEGIMNTQQEKIKDVIAKGREANGDREKIMAEVRELQQNMAKSLKEAMGEEKFKVFMKNAPMFNRDISPQGRDASRQKQ